MFMHVKGILLERERSPKVPVVNVKDGLCLIRFTAKFTLLKDKKSPKNH